MAIFLSSQTLMETNTWKSLHPTLSMQLQWQKKITDTCIHPNSNSTLTWNNIHGNYTRGNRKRTSKEKEMEWCRALQHKVKDIRFLMILYFPFPLPHLCVPCTSTKQGGALAWAPQCLHVRAWSSKHNTLQLLQYSEHGININFFQLWFDIHWTPFIFRAKYCVKSHTCSLHFGIPTKFYTSLLGMWWKGHTLDTFSAFLPNCADEHTKTPTCWEHYRRNSLAWKTWRTNLTAQRMSLQQLFCFHILEHQNLETLKL